MAFIFSTSHLPETRVRRPDRLEDEEEDDVMLPMPRAGGVRAFSHLPVRDNPAPSTAPLREDSPRREIAPIPPRSAIPTSPAPTRLEDQDDPPPSAANPEDDTAPQDHADDRPWYMPRITAQDLLPQDHPEDAHAPGLNGSASTTRDSGFSPSPQDLRDAFHAPTPDSPTREAPAQDSRPALNRGRIFEKRTAPESFLMQQLGRNASGPFSQQRLQGSNQVLAAQQQARGANPPTQGGAPAAQPQALAQAQRPAANPAQNSPAAPQPPTGGPAAKQAQTPQFQVNEADANTQFDLSDQETGRLVQKGVAFGDHVRSIINRDLENSPTAVAVFKRARELSGKDIVIHLSTDGLTVPRVGLDGAIHVYVNPKTLNPGTLAHEIAHILQDWQRTMKMRSGKTFGKEDRALDRAAGKREMEAIAPVTVEARDPQEEDDEKENEAMRIGNIVRAEVSAAKVKEQLEALRKSNEEEYNRLIQNPAEIAKMFWTEMYPPDQRIIRREGTIHQNNKYRMPESTIYGRDYFTHVVNTLGNGVTTEILKKQTPVRKEYQPGPNQKLR